VLHYCRVAAAELAPLNIRINAICPGFIATSIFGASMGMSREAAAQMAAMVAQRSGPANPVGRAGEPQDIAEAVVYLSANSGRFITGTHLIVDGGITMGPRHAWDPTAENPMMTAMGITPEQMLALRQAAAAAQG
jgi:NAD(P)-dependent dehydrogenase (short-subunit alcohol dehydrogenase family)